MRSKKLVAGLLAIAMIVTGVSIAPKKVDAAVAKTIIYEVVEAIEVGTAPVYDGITQGIGSDEDAEKLANEETITYVTAGEDAEYLFGGWYFWGQSDEGDGRLCSASDDSFSYVVDNVEYYDQNGLYFAKWVPASILSVKAQNTAGVTGDSDKTNTRVISAVDSLDYSEVGFKILLNNKNEIEETSTKKVYSSLVASDGETYAPNVIFGEDAKYFVVWRLENISQEHFEKIIYVKPYWKTADGVTVEGLAKYVHVEDGYNKYISVPVNLKDYLAYTVDEEGEKNIGAKVAAGVFEISYPDTLTLVEDKVEVGRVFGEMEFADKGSSVKFAANVADINSNATANDIYVNLRFTVDGGDVTHASYNFEIQDTPDFCDNTEAKVTIDIWDVLY